MKKVCIVRQGYFPLDPRVRKEALALIEKGFQVDLICLTGPRQEGQKRIDFDKGVNIYRIPVSRIRGGPVRYAIQYIAFFLLATIKLCSLYFRNRYDFIQINTLPDFLVFVAIVPKLFGAKVVLDLHEPTLELYGSKFGAKKNLVSRIISFVEQASIRFADRAITVSEEMKQKYVSKGADPSKITVVVNVPSMEFRQEDYQELYNKKSKRFSLMCHGAILKRYGQDLAVKAVDLLKDEIPNIHLDITGMGDSFEDELKKLVQQLDLKEHVQFHGLVPFDKMVKMLAKTDIGLVPVQKNPYSDLVHTNKMFEFIAMKKPVVITRTKAVEGFYGPDDSCIKFFESGNEKELAKCILELYKAPEKREDMVIKAFDKFKTVQWDVLKEVYCGLFK